MKIKMETNKSDRREGESQVEEQIKKCRAQ